MNADVSFDGGQKFNDDLLLSEGDRELFRSSFPKLYDVFDFPELRDLFYVHDAEANRAKKFRRRVGIIAIVLGIISLLGASAKPLEVYVPERWRPYLGGALATLGVASVLIGWFGALSAAAKRQWLLNRLLTERLRQWQFQMVVAHSPTILKAVTDPAAMNVFISSRRQWFAKFRFDYVGHIVPQLEKVLVDSTEQGFWLHESEPIPTEDSPELLQLFSAYRLLRIQHQLQYADWKLSAENPGNAATEVSRLAVLGVAAILLIFILHLLMALSLLPYFSSWLAFTDNAWAHILVVWTAIAALAARALEDGLQPTREVERYIRYRSTLEAALRRYDRAHNLEEKFKTMAETERIIYEEMNSFLVTHFNARFTL